MHAYVTVLRHRIQPGVNPDESVIVLEDDGFRFEPSRATASAEDVGPLVPLAAISL